MDILFRTENYIFSYRVAGICVKNGKVLLQKPSNDTGFAFPGGHAAFGETNEETLIREFKEEIGADISVGALEESFGTKPSYTEKKDPARTEMVFWLDDFAEENYPENLETTQKTWKLPRKPRKTTQKTRKLPRKPRKTTQKTQKLPRKLRKTTQKTWKLPRKPKKTTQKTWTLLRMTV